jgi:hypothetical protein
MKRVVVPFDLGGSHQHCILRPPLRVPPTPDEVRETVAEVRAAKIGEGSAALEVGFFHGGHPSPALLRAAQPWPVRLAASPADLAPVSLQALADQGVRTLELELLTFDDSILTRTRRGYDRAHVQALVREGHRLGLRMGGILGPGLPRSTPSTWAADLDFLATEGFQFARINPIIALKNSDLAKWWSQGRWHPPRLEAAVLLCAEAMDTLAGVPVEVVRLGLQPHHDIPVAAVAGPVHSDLRRLVETHRYGARMRAALAGLPMSGQVIFRVHPSDLAWAKGEGNGNLRALREAHPGLDARLETDPMAPRGSVEVLFGGTRSTS